MKLIMNKRSSRLPSFLKALRNTALVAGLSLSIPATAVFAQEPDNSKTNQQDRDKGAVTADQQAENQADRDLAKKIRKSITDDKNLSTYARNIKVIARGGTVMLRGPVRSEDEKTALEAKAVEIAGAANVKNQLTVKQKSEN
jgi:hyperosmotically inducible periplasmic protein